MKFLRKLFGLCDHEWRHGTNILTWNGPLEGRICDRCHTMRWRKWQAR
jgi:hypothetical protein